MAFGCKMLKRIIFIKPVRFMNINIGDIFEVHFDYDNKPYIKMKSKQKIYLTEKRNRMNYYRQMYIRGNLYK
jgi:hypothetical protein